MKFCDKKIQECLLNGGEIKRNDDDNIAIMLDDNTWCHFPKFAIECLIGKDMRDFWNFEDLE